MRTYRAVLGLCVVLVLAATIAVLVSQSLYWGLQYASPGSLVHEVILELFQDPVQGITLLYLTSQVLGAASSLLHLSASLILLLVFLAQSKARRESSSVGVEPMFQRIPVGSQQSLGHQQ